MIKTTLKLKDVVLYISNLTTNIEFKKYTLTNTDWEALQELANIFIIFISPTIKLQGQIYTTINKSLLFIYQIYNKLEKQLHILEDKQRYNNTLEYIPSLIEAIKTGLEKLKKYYPRKLNSTTIKEYKPYLFSIIVDPRFKLLHFKEQGLLHFYTTISRDISAIFKAEYFRLKADIKGKSANPTVSFNELIEDTSEVFNISDNSEKELYIQPETIEEEYIIYFKERNEGAKTHPLDWWKTNSHRFPILAVLARRYLAILATSASIESIFSIGGNIITKLRSSLQPETVKELILLKSWGIKDLEELNSHL